MIVQKTNLFNRPEAVAASNRCLVSKLGHKITVKPHCYLLLLVMITFGGQGCFAQAKSEVKARRKAVVSSKYVCLPEDIKLDTIVGVRRIETRSPVGIR